MSINPEYLRRNLLHCTSVGAHSCIVSAIARLSKQKRPRKWLMKLLRDAEERAAKLPSALACYRSAVPERLPKPQEADRG